MDNFEIEDLIEDDDKQDGNNENETNKKSKNKKEDGGEKVPIKRKQAPRVTLNAERLCGERGIALLPGIFSQVKFKGKGNEKKDLDELLKIMEHWSHRLFPRFRFDDVIEKIEVLGGKRPVQTCLRKMRLEMPLLSADFVDDEPEETTNVRGESQNVTVVDDDMFDAIFGGDIGNQSSSALSKRMDTNQISTEADNLTEDQRERILINKRLATEKQHLRRESQQPETNEASTSIKNSDSFTQSYTDVATSLNHKSTEWLTENEMLDLMEHDEYDEMQ